MFIYTLCTFKYVHVGLRMCVRVSETPSAGAQGHHHNLLTLGPCWAQATSPKVMVKRPLATDHRMTGGTEGRRGAAASLGLQPGHAWPCLEPL